MAIKFEKIQAGMTLYDVKRNNGFGGYKWCAWPVYIVSVDNEKRTVMAQWNGNKERLISEDRVTKYRAKRPD